MSDGLVTHSYLPREVTMLGPLTFSARLTSLLVWRVRGSASLLQPAAWSPGPCYRACYPTAIVCSAPHLAVPSVPPADLVQAKDLLVMDKDNCTSDPYVTLHFGDPENKAAFKQTKVALLLCS